MDQITCNLPASGVSAQCDRGLHVVRGPPLGIEMKNTERRPRRYQIYVGNSVAADVQLANE